MFIFNIFLIYSQNTEWIGFGMFFIWSLMTDTILFHETSDYVLIIIGSLLLISMFLTILAIVRLHSIYIKKSEPIKNFPERRKALDTYKFIYIACQFVLLLLVWWTQIYNTVFLTDLINAAYEKTDTLILGIGTILFLSVWMGIWINESRKETDMIPFAWAIGSSMGLVLLLSKYWGVGFEKLIKLVLIQGELGMSSYLVFLSYWIYKNSLTVIN
jgi:hypothetical protein